MLKHRHIAALSVAFALLLAACSPKATGTGSLTPAPAGEQPRPGGTLTFIVNAEPPSFDGHRETTFALLHPIAPHYSTLYKFDPGDLTKVIPDVAAAMPEVSADKLSYNITLRTDVKFHDGSVMTSEDVVATYNKIIFPPTGVLSPRAGAYAAVESISAPAKDKVQFKLKYPSASFGHEPRLAVELHLQRGEAEDRYPLVREEHRRDGAVHLRLEHERPGLGRQEESRLLRQGQEWSPAALP